MRSTWDVRSISTSAQQLHAKLCSSSVAPSTHALTYCISKDLDSGDSDIPDAKHVTLRMLHYMFEELMGKSYGQIENKQPIRVRVLYCDGEPVRMRSSECWPSSDRHSEFSDWPAAILAPLQGGMHGLLDGDHLCRNDTK